MSDAWNDIQALKNRQSNLRAKMLERRKQREGLAAELTSSGAAPTIVPVTAAASAISEHPVAGVSKAQVKQSSVSATASPIKPEQVRDSLKLSIDPEIEKKMLMVLCDISLDYPSDSKAIAEHTSRMMEREVDLMIVEELLRKFAAQKLISIKANESIPGLIVNSLDLSKLSAVIKGQAKKRRRESDEEEDEEFGVKQAKTSAGPESGDIESLLSMQSTKEREEKKLNEEIQALLVTQTAKEQYLVEKFKSRGGPQLQEFCQYGTREECQRTGPDGTHCKRLHFKKIIRKHTDESLGDCSFLNTCFHMDTCKDHSNLQNNVTTSTPQQVPQGTMQQNLQTNWYYDFENNSVTPNSYSDHPYCDQRQGVIARPFQPSCGTDTTLTNSTNVSAGPYLPTSVTDVSDIPNRSFGHSIVSDLKYDPSRSYPPNNITNPGNMSNVQTRPFQQDSIAGAKDILTNNFPQTSIPVTRDARDRHYLPTTIPDSNMGRNPPNRPYSAIAVSDGNQVQAPTLPEMPCSSFSYASIPYSLTAPPPAPAASAVPTAPYTQSADNLSFDISVPIVSHSWSLTADLFPTSSPKTAIPTTTANTKPTVKTTTTKKKKDSCAGKKRLRQPEMWKKNLAKKKKVMGEEHVSRTGNVIPAKQVESVDCSQCSFKCHENFSEGLRQQLFDVFYSLGSNESQKQFVCQNVTESLTKVSGTNKKEGEHENKRKVSRKYFLPDTDNTRKQVCSRFFCGTLAIGKSFISHALRNKQFGCYVGKEKRGKPHNKIPDTLLQPVRQHIESLLGSGSGPKKSTKKKCLELGLNITKMHEMYKQECVKVGLEAVSLSMYRRVFHTEF